VKEVTLEIDEKEVKAKEGMTILEAAKSVGIDIPTLCYHEKLEPYGACRICSVEIGTGARARLVASCAYPVEENLKVRTRTSRVIKTRKVLLELLLACAPGAKIIRDLAHEYGVGKTRFEEEQSFCIL
jgi:NADH dehydrogenase/NADH:ubiquinone oxidoreductase subunit G